MDELTKALEVLAVGNADGYVSNDVLIKACNEYKIKKGLVDDLDYEIKVSKTLFDAINGVKPDEKICKAIVPGQTKVVDGIMYIYSATKSGSKNQYDWHVVRKGAKTNQPIGRGSKLTNQQIDAKQKFVNELFPKDLSSLKVIKQLNGSTHPELVEDIDGNQFVMKKSGNTNKDHVKSEYLANQLYNILGQRTPDFELYDDNGNTIVLSRFIQGAHSPHQSDWGKMAEGFISDVILANWDVYQNDNCMVDAAGRIIRCDNGGSLKYRAQGAIKTNPPFNGDVLATYKSMRKYNPGISNLLTDDELVAQIDAALAKKDDIVNYLKYSGEDDLAKILGERIDNLTKIKDEITLEAARKQAILQARMGKIAPRKLKSKADMYKELDDKTLEDIWKNALSNNGGNAHRALISTGSDGWDLLSTICKERGFDARPKVVTEKEFWQARSKTKHPLMFRGLHADKGRSAQDWADDFRFSDGCFYGTWGIWGQGIYAHADDQNSNYLKTYKYDPEDNKDNKSTEQNYKNSRSYDDAVSYANGDNKGVLKMMWEPDADVIDLDDLLDDIQKNPPSSASSKKVKDLQEEVKKLKKEWGEAVAKVQNLEDTIRSAVYVKIHYNDDVTKDVYDTIDGTDWGKRNIQGKRDYPDFKDFVLGKMKKWVEDNGGLVDYDTDNETVEFNFGSESLYISKHAWENNAVKQKNGFTNPYHYQAERFKTFYDTNCVAKAHNAVVRELNNSDGLAKKLQTAVADAERDYNAKKLELDTELQNAGVDDGVYGAVYNAVKNLKKRSNGTDMSTIGIYAALQGYDGIYVHNGNDSNHGFNVILNRSKIITSID